MLKTTLGAFAFGLLLVSSALAGSDDIALVRSYAPAGSDLAQYQIAILKRSSVEDAGRLALANFIYSDFNGDGIRDLAVIFEKNPTLFNYETNQACTDYDPSEFDGKCSLVPGARTLQIFMGQANGSKTLFVSNLKMILDADSGGIWGDPLAGMTLNKKGSLVISVYGGSSWRWWHTDTVQFREGAFYIVGQTDGGVHSVDPENTLQEKHLNLITGEVSETKTSGQRVHTKVRVKPLVNLKDFVSPMLAH